MFGTIFFLGGGDADMFSKFKLDDISLSDFDNYKVVGQEFYNDYKIEIQTSLQDFINENGIIDGTLLQEYWFPIKKHFDIFLSHSHNDEKLAISLAGFLKKEMGLNTFIDSCLWGYSNNLLWKIDDKYCRHSNGTSFDYYKRNYSTSHVHMMLSIALSRMIDACESVFFLNSENSIILEKELEKKLTSSPWIFNELSVADIMRIRSIEDYRAGEFFLEHGDYSIVNENANFTIEYDVSGVLKSFIPLSVDELREYSKDWKNNYKSFQSSMDYIYLSKKVIRIKYF